MVTEVISLKVSRRLLPLAATTLAGAAAYRYLVAPRIQTWGATPEEVLRPMAGDELVPDPTVHATHAITIEAPPEDIWPWLVQIGYGRAGFYSYEWIEKLMGLPGIQNANTIQHEFQAPKLGDVVPFGPGTDAGLSIAALDPNRHLCFSRVDATSAITWAFGLYPLDTQHTRLVSRNLAYMPDWTLAQLLRQPSRWRTELPMKLFINLGAFVMVRKMLLGIKCRAERIHGEEVAEEQALALSSGCE